MDKVEEFIVEQNVAHFFNRLLVENEPLQRAALQKLMLVEERRFGQLSDQLNRAEGLIQKCHGHIQRNGAFLERPEGGISHEIIRQTIRNLEHLREFLIDYRNKVRDQLDRL